MLVASIDAESSNAMQGVVHHHSLAMPVLLKMLPINMIVQ